MSGDRMARVRRIFEDAMSRSAGQREDFLEAACAGDDALRDEVASLLAARDRMGEFLETPAADEILRVETPRLPVGFRVAGYEIVGVLGSGGSATVYEALQQSPRRRVALKVMHAELVSESALSRFRDEAEILARLDHPDIAYVYEAGVLDVGGQRIPWFALELVASAQNILAYVERNALDKRERLALLARICDAVHHGHQKGILHRDIKPENILIDGSGRPRIIDFGIAAVARLDESHPPATEIAGTLAYMSPEQCELTGADVDVRSDVYALGVLVYEVLTGSLPHDVSGSPLPEAARRIREAAPVRISKVDPSLGGDVELIVHRAIARRREERHQSAADLGRDLRNYLEFRPVSARRSTLAYQFRLLARRRTGVVLALAGLLAVLVAGTVISTTFGLRAERDRRTAIAAGSREREQSYLANLSAADAALRVYDVGEARRRLRRAPPACRKWEWWYLAGRLDTSERTLVSSGGLPFSYLAVHPDGSRILAAEHEEAEVASTLRIWSAAEGKLLLARTEKKKWIRSPRWSPDGRWLAWGETGRYVVLAPSDDLERARRWDCGEEEVARLVFDPKGARIATMSEIGGIRIWKVPEGDLLAEIGADELTPGDIAFDPTGRWLASCANDRAAVTVWDLEGNGPPRTLEGHEKGVVSLDYAADGRRLVSGSFDGTIRIWDVPSGRALRILTRDREPVRAVAFSPDDRRVLSGHLDGSLSIWDAARGIRLKTLWGHTDSVESVAWGPGRGQVCSASRDGTVRLWRRGATPLNAVLGRQEQLVRGLAYSSDGSLLAGACFDETIKVYDPQSGKEVAVLEGHDGGVQAVAFVPGARTLVSGGYDGTLRVWDPETASCRLVCGGHEAAVLCVTASPDGTRLASGSTNRTAILWDAATGERLATFPHPAWVWAVAFGPSGRLLLTACADGRIRLWSLDTGREVRSIRTGSPGLKCAVLRRDGSSVICGGIRGRLSAFEVATGRRLVDVQGFSGPIEGLALTPDESRVIGVGDRSIRLFDLETGQRVLSLRGHRSLVYGVAVHPDGSQIATGGGGWMGEGATIRLWGRVPGQAWPPDVRWVEHGENPSD